MKKKIINIFLLLVIFNFGAKSNSYGFKFQSGQQKTGDTLHEYYKNSLKKSAIISGSLLTGGLIMFSNPVYDRHNFQIDFRNLYPTFNSHIDDYLQFSPLAIMYGLDLSGIKPRNNFIEQTIISVKAEIFAIAVSYALKYSTHVMRPDGSNSQSFPSGHTTQAFMAATMLHEEFGQNNIGISIAAFGLATTTGAMRMWNNKHWISDVLAGAAFGYFFTELAYYTHRYKFSKRKNDKITLLPYYNNQTFGLAATFGL